MSQEQIRVDDGLIVEHLVSLFLLRLIERQYDGAAEVVDRLSALLHGHPDEALLGLLQGCLMLGDGHDLQALKTVFAEMEKWLTKHQVEMTRTVCTVLQTENQLHCATI